MSLKQHPVKSKALARILLSLLLIDGFCVAAPPAKAQGVFDMGVLTNTVSQGAVVKSESERARRTGKSVRFGKTTRAAFTPSAAVRKRSIQRFIEGVRTSDPQTAASLEKQFATRDIFGSMSKQFAPYGLQTNSLTDAMTAYLVSAWQAVHGETAKPGKSQVAGVRKQIGQAFADVPAIGSAPSTAKQEMADALLLQTLLIDANVEFARNKPDQMRLVKTSVATGARATIGFDLAALRLTSSGLQK